MTRPIEIPFEYAADGLRRGDFSRLAPLFGDLSAVHLAAKHPVDVLRRVCWDSRALHVDVSGVPYEWFASSSSAPWYSVALPELTEFGTGERRCPSSS
jgi:hypothetical protein